MLHLKVQVSHVRLKLFSGAILPHKLSLIDISNEQKVNNLKSSAVTTMCKCQMEMPVSVAAHRWGCHAAFLSFVWLWLLHIPLMASNRCSIAPIVILALTRPSLSPRFSCLIVVAGRHLPAQVCVPHLTVSDQCGIWRSACRGAGCVLLKLSGCWPFHVQRKMPADWAAYESNQSEDREEHFSLSKRHTRSWTLETRQLSSH